MGEPAPGPRSAVIVANPGAGSSGAEALEAVVAALTAAGVRAEVRRVEGPDLAGTAEREAGLVDIVVAAGGDGTVNAVAGGVLRAGGLLGVIPMGTLNHFAKDLGLPQDPAQAALVVARGVVRTIDVGEVNGRHFLNNASVGAYPEAVRHRDRLQEARGLGKWPAMAIATARVARDLRGRRVELVADGRISRLRVTGVLVANNPYAIDSFPPVGRERIDRGLLGVYALAPVRLSRHLLVALRAVRGSLRGDDAVTALTAREVVLRRAGPGALPIAVDGEPMGDLAAPFTFRTLPGALRVMAGPAADG